MIKIQPRYLSLSELLENRLFRIPDYQRAYSWTRHQRQDLFGDIDKTHKNGAEGEHFMAAVVCLERETQTLGTDEFQVMEVVDGQQRLTTLIILLNAIKLALDKKNQPEKKILRDLSELLIKEGDELLLLQTNHDASQFFTNYLRKGTAAASGSAKTLADRELLAAIEDCQEFVSNWQSAGESLPSLVALLKNRLHFLLHEIDDEKIVYTVFEVLNSRGLDVSWLDRLKSILMGAAYELKKANQTGVIDELHTIWREVYAVVGLRQGLSTEALKFAATLWVEYAPRRPLGEEGSVDTLRKDANSAKAIRDVAAWLLRVTKACDEIIAQRRINAVTRIAQARLLAAAINLREDITATDRKKLLRRWEKVSFRIYGMLRKDARTRVGEFVRLAWRVVNEKLSVKAIDAEIQDIGSEFPIEKAVDNLRKSNCYEGWEGALRYFMFRYEEHLAEQQGLPYSNKQWERIWMASAVESIEHISPRLTASAKVKHRLGNLVLLPPRINSKLQAKKPSDKTDAYRKTGLLIAGDVADVIEQDGWNTKAIAAREDALLDWAATEWAD